MASQLDIAEAQLTGFAHRQKGYSIQSLASSMGLTKKEWNKIKEKGINYLDDSDIKYLNEYFETN